MLCVELMKERVEERKNNRYGLCARDGAAAQIKDRFLRGLARAPRSTSKNVM